MQSISTARRSTQPNWRIAAGAAIAVVLAAAALYYLLVRPSSPTTMRWRIDRGGRYDTNTYIDVYPQMGKEYENDNEK